MRHRDLLRALALLPALLLAGAAAVGAGGPRSPVATRGPLARAWPAGVHAATIAPLPADTDLLLVHARPGSAASDLAARALAEALTRLGYAAQPISPLLAAVRVRVPAGTDPATLARALAATGLLAAVEPDVRVHAHRLPDDPLLAAQRPYMDAIRAPAAWDTATTAATVTIAVVDTGVDATHPDLAGRIALNARETFDARDEDSNGCVDDLRGCSFVSPAAADPSCGYTAPAPRGGALDDEGHGTFVAGIAAAAGDNAAGGTGVVWDTRVLPVKVLDCTATGRIADAAAGVLYAARAGARVIVVAFGSTTDARVLREAVAEAIGRYGALVIASVGNEGGARVQFPAAYPGVLAVAGSGVVRDDGSVDYRAPAVFSNAGPEVALYAPALRLLAPVPPAACGLRSWLCVEGQPYARASGTSFAAPLAAGAAALLLARDPDLTPALLAALLRGGAQPLTGAGSGPGSGPLFASGRGLLDIAGTLALPLTVAHAPGASRGPYGPPAQGPGADPLLPPLVPGAGGSSSGTGPPLLPPFPP